MVRSSDGGDDVRRGAGLRRSDGWREGWIEGVRGREVSKGRWIKGVR